MWDELVNYEPIPTCSWSGCKCNIVVKIEKKQEEESVF